VAATAATAPVDWGSAVPAAVAQAAKQMPERLQAALVALAGPAERREPLFPATRLPATVETPRHRQLQPAAVRRLPTQPAVLVGRRPAVRLILAMAALVVLAALVAMRLRVPRRPVVDREPVEMEQAAQAGAAMVGMPSDRPRAG